MTYAREGRSYALKGLEFERPAPDWGGGEAQSAPELKLVATVTLNLESSRSAGETPDGVRLELRVHGEVTGPALNGSFPSLGAHMLVDKSGIGTLYVRAPLVLKDGAVLEIEATVRYDFGPNGYESAVKDQLPDSAVAGALRFLTGHERYRWLNRELCLGVGALYSREKRIVYDLFVIGSKPVRAEPSKAQPGPSAGYPEPRGSSLYERLGAQEGLGRIAADFFYGLETNPQLARQNPRIASASAGADPRERDRRFAEYLCQLTGGPCKYSGPALERVHAPMGLSGADWTIGGEELVRALNKNNVSRADQNELLALIEPLKARIVQGRP
jgi:hemoglobin